MCALWSVRRIIRAATAVSLATALSVVVPSLVGHRPVHAQGAGAPGSSSAPSPIDATSPVPAVLAMRSTVPANARTAATLGTERRGSAILIDDAGLALTIAYLVLEAETVTLTTATGREVAATLVGWDPESGLALLRTATRVDATPLKLAKGPAPEQRTVLRVVSRADGQQAGLAVIMVDRRPFAGYWEYYIEQGLFTSPPHDEFGGAALLDAKGDLVGVGSLFVIDAWSDATRRLPGNMFVPSAMIAPVMGDLLASGARSGPPRPWIGVTSEEDRERVWVRRVTEDGPAAKAGLKAGDLLISVGDRSVGTLADFYKSMWALGPAGTTVPITVLRGARLEKIEVRSIDRERWLKKPTTY